MISIQNKIEIEIEIELPFIFCRDIIWNIKFAKDTWHKVHFMRMCSVTSDNFKEGIGSLKPADTVYHKAFTGHHNRAGTRVFIHRVA
jgi:hypothetical protein